MEERNSFVFYQTFREQMNGMPDNERLALYDAITNYGLYGEVTEFDVYYLNGMFLHAKTAIDNSTQRYDEAIENGKKGGKPSRFSEHQKEVICERYQSGETYEKIAADLNCSYGTVRNIIIKNLKVNDDNNINKGGICNNNHPYCDNNLNDNVNVNVNDNVNVNVNVNDNLKPTDNDQQPTDLQLVINQSERLGVPVDEPTADRIIAHCNTELIARPDEWFRFCWEKTSSKGLLSGKSKEESKRIVVSAAINSKNKWGYLEDDYRAWLRAKHPKPWTSGIELPPVEECATAQEVEQVFNGLHFRTAET